jgi:hypothetical protein
MVVGTLPVPVWVPPEEEESKRRIPSCPYLLHNRQWQSHPRFTNDADDIAPTLTFADLSDVEVEPSDGEVGVLDLRCHLL